MLNIGGNKKRAYLGAKGLSNAHLGEVLVYSGMEPFTLTFNIANSPEVLTLPTPTNYLVDWGDGTTSDDNNQHLYTTAGVYTVKMFGVIDDFAFNNGGDKNKLLSIDNIGGLLLKEGSFNGCINLGLCVGGTYKTVPSGNIRNAFNFCPSLRFDSEVVIDFNNALEANTLQLFNLNNGGNGVNVNIKYTNAQTLSCRSDFRQANSFNSIVDFDNITLLSLNQFFEANTAINKKPINVDTSQCVRFNSMFRGAASFNKDISDWDYSSAITVENFMAGKTAADYDYQYLDALYNKWAFGDPITGEGKLDFTKLTNFTTNFGTIQYSSAGAAARAFLVSEGLIITDGGNNGL